MLYSAMLIAAALAAPGSDPMGGSGVAAPAAPAPVVTPATNDTHHAETRYCVVDKPTGSLLVRRTCRTRDQWIASDGVDPLTVIR